MDTSKKKKSALDSLSFLLNQSAPLTGAPSFGGVSIPKQDEYTSTSAYPFDPAIDGYPDDPYNDPKKDYEMRSLGMMGIQPDKVEVDGPALNRSMAAAAPDFNAIEQEVDEAQEPDLPAMPVSKAPELDEPMPTQPEVALDDYRAALEKKRKDTFIDAVLRAGNAVGTGIAGEGTIQPDFRINEAFEKLTGMEAENIKDATGYDVIRTARDQALAEADPASDMSSLSRAAVVENLRKIGKNKLADQVESQEMSHKQLTGIFGSVNLANMVAQYDNTELRKVLAKEKVEAKAQQKEDKRAEKETKLRQQLRGEIQKFDEKTKMTENLNNIQGLKEIFSKKQFTGIDDIKALYSIIKALDPESVVRESEVELMQMSQPGFAKIINAPRKFFKGDIFTDAYRKQLLGRIENLVNNNVKSFRMKAAGTLKEIERQGYDPEQFLSDELPLANILRKAPEVKLSSDQKQGIAAELERRKKAKQGK